MAYKGPFKVVQPWGKDKGREATVVREFATAQEAFEARAAFLMRMRELGSGRGVELLVADSEGTVVPPLRGLN